MPPPGLSGPPGRRGADRVLSFRASRLLDPPVDARAMRLLVADTTRGAAAAELVYKDDPRSRVALFRIDGRGWVVKQYWWPSARRGWLAYRLRASPGWREWRSFARLRACAVRVVDALAIASSIHADGRFSETIITAAADGPTLLDWLGDDHSPEARRRVARAVGRQMGLMAAARLVNRDHKPENLIIDAACEQRGEQPVMIDPARVKRLVRKHNVFRMMFMLWKRSLPAGPMSQREVLTVAAEVFRACPGMAPRGRRLDALRGYFMRRIRGQQLYFKRYGIHLDAPTGKPCA